MAPPRERGEPSAPTRAAAAASARRSLLLPLILAAVVLFARLQAGGCFLAARGPHAGSLARRSLLVAAPLASFIALPGSPAAAEEPYQVELPSRRWREKKRLTQAIRVRKETVYEAIGGGGGTVTITRTPLGSDRAAAENRERIMEIAGAFDRNRQKDLSKETIVSLLTQGFDNTETRRERKWLDVRRDPDSIVEYTDAAGQRYVQFAYDAKDCAGTVFEFKRGGKVSQECDGEDKGWRRHLLVATVMPTRYTSMRSSYLNGVNSGSLSRLLESLWLLDASAYVDAPGQASAPDLAAIAKSFSVTLPVLQEDEVV